VPNRVVKWVGLTSKVFLAIHLDGNRVNPSKGKASLDFSVAHCHPGCTIGWPLATALGYALRGEIILLWPYTISIGRSISIYIDEFFGLSSDD
jgi:hypothetical protein